ncbi:hypothetical protein F0231_20695 [Vibrio sp. RE86]|uniref:hypothetical protein n=1 Tax=Vibrio sp. RE86 TaxID=2607605 RepID=UPI0014932F40|nr:hypothetical protein [Vibrio sp. RE86]NOH82135.1 hypothetical protein [Vibrio sp. RE86]
MKKEREIHKMLVALSKQRVALVLQPGNVWVIEKALPLTEKNEAHLQTCLMRGWVEVLEANVASGKLNEDLTIPSDPFTTTSNIYRLTDSGWNHIHQTHLRNLLGLFATVMALGVAVIGLV